MPRPDHSVPGANSNAFYAAVTSAITNGRAGQLIEMQKYLDEMTRCLIDANASNRQITEWETYIQQEIATGINYGDDS